jgi:hypothetical protein
MRCTCIDTKENITLIETECGGYRVQNSNYEFLSIDKTQRGRWGDSVDTFKTIASNVNGVVYIYNMDGILARDNSGFFIDNQAGEAYFTTGKITNGCKFRIKQQRI